jgi:hypothetical protein
MLRTIRRPTRWLVAGVVGARARPRGLMPTSGNDAARGDAVDDAAMRAVVGLRRPHEGTFR